MAITKQDSVQIANGKSFPPKINPASDDGGRVRAKYFSFVQAGQGDEDSLAYLAKMPGGKVRVLEIYVANSTWGAGRVVDVGFESYTDADGNGVAADYQHLIDNLAVATAGTTILRINKALETPAGWMLTGRISGDTAGDGNTLEGFVTYVAD